MGNRKDDREAARFGLWVAIVIGATLALAGIVVLVHARRVSDPDRWRPWLMKVERRDDGGLGVSWKETDGWHAATVAMPAAEARMYLSIWEGKETTFLRNDGGIAGTVVCPLEGLDACVERHAEWTPGVLCGLAGLAVIGLGVLGLRRWPALRAPAARR